MRSWVPCRETRGRSVPTSHPDIIAGSPACSVKVSLCVSVPVSSLKAGHGVMSSTRMVVVGGAQVNLDKAKAKSDNVLGQEDLPMRSKMKEARARPPGMAATHHCSRHLSPC